MILTTSNTRALVYTATILVSVLSLSTAQAERNSCEAFFNSQTYHDLTTTTYYQRGGQKTPVDYFNPLRYLAEKTRKAIYGVVENEFSEKFDTRFYFTGNSVRTNTKVPFEIDPQSKGVYIFFHGSGTAQSSGKNFYGLMNNLSKLGFSALSFDMPFHGEGPLSPKFDDVNYFMKWIDSIVMEAKKSGKPVYLVGHSFGPDVISEYITRNPFTVNGALLMSPAGFDKVLADWYENHTSKMRFGGEVPQNEAGGIWAYKMSSQSLWNKSKLPDPTLVNPALKVHLLSGNMEEYVPAPTGGAKKTPIAPNTYDIGSALRVFFQNADVVIEKGVGHYLFNHVDENGFNSVLREILRISGNNLKDAKDLKKLSDEASMNGSQATYSSRLMVRYSYDGNFRTFVNHYMGEKNILQKMKNGNDFLAKNILDQYEIYARDYEMKLAEYLISGSSQVAQFQKQYSNPVQGARASFKDRYEPVLIAFGTYLEGLPPEKVQAVLSGFKYEHPTQVGNLKK